MTEEWIKRIVDVDFAEEGSVAGLIKRIFLYENLQDQGLCLPKELFRLLGDDGFPGLLNRLYSAVLANLKAFNLSLKSFSVSVNPHTKNILIVLHKLLNTREIENYYWLVQRSRSELPGKLRIGEPGFLKDLLRPEAELLAALTNELGELACNYRRRKNKLFKSVFEQGKQIWMATNDYLLVLAKLYADYEEVRKALSGMAEQAVVLQGVLLCTLNAFEYKHFASFNVQLTFLNMFLLQDNKLELEGLPSLTNLYFPRLPLVNAPTLPVEAFCLALELAINSTHMEHSFVDFYQLYCLARAMLPHCKPHAVLFEAMRKWARHLKGELSQVCYWGDLQQQLAQKCPAFEKQNSQLKEIRERLVRLKLKIKSEEQEAEVGYEQIEQFVRTCYQPFIGVGVHFDILLHNSRLSNDQGLRFVQGLLAFVGSHKASPCLKPQQRQDLDESEQALPQQQQSQQEAD